MVHRLSAGTRFIHSRSSLLLLDFRAFTHVLLISSLCVCVSLCLCWAHGKLLARLAPPFPPPIPKQVGSVVGSQRLSDVSRESCVRGSWSRSVELCGVLSAHKKSPSKHSSDVMQTLEKRAECVFVCGCGSAACVSCAGGSMPLLPQHAAAVHTHALCMRVYS